MKGWIIAEMGQDVISISPVCKVGQVISTMAVENMYIDKEYAKSLLKIVRNELSPDEVIAEMVKKYV